LQRKNGGEILPQINESAILGFRDAGQKIGTLFLITKCVDLNDEAVLIFFKLWMTVENRMDNPSNIVDNPVNVE
jgi:hypothetical protein